MQFGFSSLLCLLKIMIYDYVTLANDKHADSGD